MLMRDSSGSSVRATVRLSMLYPRADNTPVTRINAPGLFSTNREISCNINTPSRSHRLRRPQDHFINSAARGKHRMHVFVRSHAHIEQIRTGLANRSFQRASQLAWTLDRAAAEPVRPSQFFGIRERIEPNCAEAIVIEQLLPLPDHPQIPVIHHDDLDG